MTGMGMGNISLTFKVGYRWRCTLTAAVDAALAAIAANAPGGQLTATAAWHPKMPRRLSGREGADYRRGQETFEAEVAKVLGDKVLVFETPGGLVQERIDPPVSREDHARLIEDFFSYWLGNSDTGRQSAQMLGFDGAMDALWESLNAGLIKIESGRRGLTGITPCIPPKPPAARIARPIPGNGTDLSRQSRL